MPSNFTSSSSSRPVYRRPASRRLSPAARRRRRRNKLLARGALAAVCLGLCLLALWLLWPRNKAEVPAGPGSKGPWCIGLDAGHGGTDPGAQGLVQESEMTEATVRALQTLLEADPNFTVALCRDWGETVTKPSLRAERGNKEGADLLLSVHGNSDPGGTADGFECFPITPGNKYAEESRQFAHCVADAFEEAGSRLRGESGVRYTYYDANDEKFIVEESDQTVRTEDSFGFLEYAQCPALLAEQCFLTSPEDVALFASEDGVKRAARCYYEAICAYYGVKPLAA